MTARKTVADLSASVDLLEQRIGSHEDLCGLLHEQHAQAFGKIDKKLTDIAKSSSAGRKDVHERIDRIMWWLVGAAFASASGSAVLNILAEIYMKR